MKRIKIIIIIFIIIIIIIIIVIIIVQNMNIVTLLKVPQPGIAYFAILAYLNTVCIAIDIEYDHLFYFGF